MTTSALDRCGELFYGNSKAYNTDAVFNHILWEIQASGVIIFYLPKFCRENVIDKLMKQSRESTAYRIVVSIIPFTVTKNGVKEEDVQHKIEIKLKNKKSRNKEPKA
jgi:hypothetical protein